MSIELEQLFSELMLSSILNYVGCPVSSQESSIEVQEVSGELMLLNIGVRTMSGELMVS